MADAMSLTKTSRRTAALLEGPARRPSAMGFRGRATGQENVLKDRLARYEAGMIERAKKMIELSLTRKITWADG